MQETGYTTRHIVVDQRFAGILAEDFGLDAATVTRALDREPQREAIALCEWAAGTDDPSRALVAWARKHRRGQFRKARRNLTPAQQRAELDRRAG